MYPNIYNVYNANRYRILKRIILNRSIIRCKWYFLTESEELSCILENMTKIYYRCDNFEVMMKVMEGGKWFWDDDVAYRKGGIRR